MVTVRINSTGEKIDVQGKITYVKQVSDIADITKANSSYTWQLTFPKTPNNVKAFQMLGIAGSSSTTPYDKIVCQVLDNGIMIEPNGNLIITETTEKEYKGHVKAGIIDFLQDISNDSIADVIDLSSLGHLNTPSNIIDNFTADLAYKYIVAYYNGQQIADVGGVTNLNPFALVPSIDVEYLWDAIFAHYGWTYSGNFSLQDLWMTYPNAIGYSSDGSILALDAFVPAQSIWYQGESPGTRIQIPISVSSIDNQFIQASGNAFIIQETGNYNIKASVTGQVFMSIWGNLVPITDIKWQVFVSGQYQPVYSDSGDEVDFPITAPQGTLIYLHFYSDKFPYIKTEISEGYLKIETRGVQQVDFSEALIKIKVKDFFKEMMIREGLTPFVDVENKAIRFRTLNERLTAPAVDWSSKYVERTSEKYIYQSYAQDNLIKHKYNDPNVDYADGVLVVDNENQPAEKTLYDSFSYAPEQELMQITTNLNTYNVQNFRMFDVEVQVDENDDLIANYKQLKDRFYFIRSQRVEETIYVLGELATAFPLAIYSEVFQDIVNDKFSNIGQIINNAKIEKIELALTKADVVGLDFYRRYYFAQEKAYFLLNNLTWKSGDVCVGEFVKINS